MHRFARQPLGRDLVGPSPVKTPRVEFGRRVEAKEPRAPDVNAVHGVDRRGYFPRTTLRIVDDRPELGLLGVEFCEFAPVMGLDVGIGIAAERLDEGLFARTA